MLAREFWPPETRHAHRTADLETGTGRGGPRRRWGWVTADTAGQCVQDTCQSWETCRRVALMVTRLLVTFKYLSQGKWTGIAVRCSQGQKPGVVPGPGQDERGLWPSREWGRGSSLVCRKRRTPAARPGAQPLHEGPEEKTQGGPASAVGSRKRHSSQRPC